jgi:hypothetical protein
MSAALQPKPEDDALSSRDCLVASFAKQVQREGYYLTWIKPLSPQQLIDLQWAAQMAGRRLGSKTHSLICGRSEPEGRLKVVVYAERTLANAAKLDGAPKAVRALFR